MTQDSHSPTRRSFLRQGMALSAAPFFCVPGRFAEELVLTPDVGEGPYYPRKFPRDNDNDLLIINDSITPAVGEVTHLSGRILGKTGAPIRNALLEIWQVDSNGIYIDDEIQLPKRDEHFQGYGRFLTGSEGSYYFRTIKPIPYQKRCPHIHFAVSLNGRRVLASEVQIKGHPLTERDGVHRSVKDPEARKRLLAEFVPLPDSRIGELAAQFDIVLGVTPEAHPHGTEAGK